MSRNDSRFIFVNSILEEAEKMWNDYRNDERNVLEPDAIPKRGDAEYPNFIAATAGVIAASMHSPQIMEKTLKEYEKRRAQKILENVEPARNTKLKGIVQREFFKRTRSCVNLLFDSDPISPKGNEITESILEEIWKMEEIQMIAKENETSHEAFKKAMRKFIRGQRNTMISNFKKTFPKLEEAAVNAFYDFQQPYKNSKNQREKLQVQNCTLAQVLNQVLKPLKKKYDDIDLELFPEDNHAHRAATGLLMLALCERFDKPFVLELIPKWFTAGKVSMD